MSQADDTYLVMCKQARLSDAITAARLGKTLQWVEKRWAELQAQAEKFNSNGYVDLIRQFTILANQYQLVGESLKAVAEGLHRTVHTSDLEAMGCPPELALRLLESFIILQPYVPVDPEAALNAQVKN